MKTVTHKHYEQYSEEMILRLGGLYGAVDARMNTRIEEWIAGTRVLDVGCGFGSLVEHLRQKGFQSVGIDLLESHITAGKRHFPKADIRLSSGTLDFEDKSIDTIILKDTIHHILGERDIDQFFSELTRVCSQRVIIMDPNPSPVLLTARKIIGHQDPVCKYDSAREILEKCGCQVIYSAFTDVIAFPLSGGFVGKPIISQPHLFPPILKIDEILERFFCMFHLEWFICWRYMLVGEFSHNEK